MAGPARAAQRDVPPELRRARRKARRDGLAAQSVQAPAAPLAALPCDAMALYRDIAVVHSRAYRLRSILTDGGPLWPDFSTQDVARFRQRDRFVDEPAAPARRPAQAFRGPATWGGFAIAHFGHLVADHLSRVLVSRVKRPEDRMLFVTSPGGASTVPETYFWDLLAWYGLERPQVHLVTAPLIVSELRVFAQAEPLDGPGPDAQYLDLLDRNAEERALQPKASDVLYVARSGLLAQGKGGTAGESYLVETLARLGVPVLDPARASLTAQLAAYAGARALIFAEGSAVHGRQLLGRLDQRIEVLNRRRGARMAENCLRPRCRDLRHVETAAQNFAIGTMAARRQGSLSLSRYDLPELFAAFRRHGVDLADHWRAEDFAARERADAETWLAGLAQRDAPRMDMDAARLELRAAGVDVAEPEAWWT